MNQNWTDAVLWTTFATQVLVQLLGILLFLSVGTLVYLAHRDPNNKKINLDSLLYDKETKSTSLAKLMGLLGGATGTWVFVYLPVSGHFDATYAIGYLTVMIAGKVAADVTNKIGK